MAARYTLTPSPERVGTSVPHAWLGRDVQDLLDGRCGTLMDVCVEENQYGLRYDAAYIRGADAREFVIPVTQMRLVSC
ncbi:hypothetical protein C0216_09015 [Streptomyces globosus]|uniref:Uncharacterized protein n=1 Tax=Streptomyces globosus TaxID=68209 RepID=A0A344TY65_9ACTN|nr:MULTISPECIES: hypothetical protein [Streptomyces]AXE23586.1 hypothetical protein C0216_09015 [Streptomyces globosus]